MRRSLLQRLILGFLVPSLAYGQGELLNPCPVNTIVTPLGITMEGPGERSVTYSAVEGSLIITEPAGTSNTTLTTRGVIPPGGGAVANYRPFLAQSGDIGYEVTFEAFAVREQGIVAGYFPGAGTTIVVARSITDPLLDICMLVHSRHLFSRLDKVISLYAQDNPGLVGNLYALLAASRTEGLQCQQDLRLSRDREERALESRRTCVRELTELEDGLREERRRKSYLQDIHAISYRALDRVSRAAKTGDLRGIGKIVKMARRQTALLTQQFQAGR